MKRNKCLVLFTTCLLSFCLLLVSCGGSPSEDSKDSNKGEKSTSAGSPPASEKEDALTYKKTGESYTRDEQGYPQLKGVTLKIWMPIAKEYVDVVTTYAEMDVVKKWMETCDVNLKFAHPPLGQEAANFAVMIAGDELPDMIFSNGIDDYYPGKSTMAYEDGLLFDYTKLVSKKNTPLFIKKVADDPYFTRAIKDDEGRINTLGVAVSGSEESCTTMFGLMTRKDMLEATGMDVPVTIDDWYQMLKAMKANGVEYPLIIDGDNYWKTRNTFSNAYGISANDYYIKDDNKTIAYGPYEDAYYDYLSTMSKWYAEGLINPDFMNQDQQQTWSMIADGVGACTVNHLYNYNPYYYMPVESKDPSKAMVAVDFPVLKKGDTMRLMVTNRNIGNRKYITVDTEYPLACVLLLDSLYDDDLEFMFSNGIEGLGYTMSENNYPVINTITADTTDEELLGSRIYPLEIESDSDLDYLLTDTYCFGAQVGCVQFGVKQSYEGILGEWRLNYTSEESETISKYDTDLNTYRDEMMLKFITGQEKLTESSFDAYRKKMKDLKMEELIAIRQAAYDRYLNR